MKKMKPFLFLAQLTFSVALSVALLAFSAPAAHAQTSTPAASSAPSTPSQTPKTVVNCWISNGKVNYGPLAQLLPDSISSSLLIDVHKKLNTSDGNLILLWLEQQGWTLLAVDSNTGTFPSIYVLSKEIALDEPARNLFLQKLEKLHNK